MSNLSMQGGATGSGTVTLLAPVTNTNRTLTLPDATGALLASGDAIAGTTGTFSGDLSFNSGYGSAAVGYGCRAWVNFNGTGTVAIRASGNVSSITDNGTGNYTVNFTTAMPDANYSVGTETVDTSSGNNAYVRESAGSRATRTSSAYQISIVQTASYTLTDCNFVCVSFFR